MLLSDAEDELGITVPDENILSMKTIAGAASVIAPLVGIPSGVSEQEDGAESSFDTEDGSGD